MAENRCYFKEKFKCDSKTDLSTSGPSRVLSIIKFSKEYHDGIHLDLSSKYQANPNLQFECHRSCVSSYTSKHHLERHKKRCAEELSSKPAKKRRSDVPAFQFKEQCIFCGEICDIERDKKHPDRWQKAALCQTAEANAGQKSFKQSILDVCSQRNDELAHDVRVRVEGALSDLHAADARYHVNCMSRFMAPRSIAAARNSANINEPADPAFDQVVSEMKADKARMWNTNQLFIVYQQSGGRELTRRSLLKRVKEHFSSDVAVLSSSGLCSVVVFRNSASSLISLTSDIDDDEKQDAVIEKLAKQICSEIKQMTPHDRSRYEIRITKEDMSIPVSQTLMDLLAALTDKLDNTLPALLIGNIITNVISNKPTNLQIALGNLIRDSKKVLNQLYQFRVTCSYDEILRLKKSAAIAATEDIKLSGIEKASDGLIQAVADNFDADISSQNGKLTTHSLAMLITQPTQNSADQENEQVDSIRRISKSEMSQPIDFDIPVQRYQGPKIVPMPENCATKKVLPLKVLCSAAIAERRAKEIDFSFLGDIVENECCPEYNGYNTKLTREQGVSAAPKTQAAYLPLIDMTPSNPDTMMTALHEAQKLSAERGQKSTIFTSDQQLYKVAVEVKWANQERFSDVFVRLGGMHMLMSFVGAIGTLMQGSGLSDVLASTFAGVAKMLSGKKFPQNVRALRLVCEELLRKVMSGNDEINTMDELSAYLEEISRESKTTKLWVDCLIKPIFIIMLFVRAEREGDWPLHLVAVKQMLPYFFASSHVNYARYGLYYLRSMEGLDDEVLSRFMKGEHAMHHVPGVWNGIWSDMFIETTFMRYGHAPGGIIGITLKPESLKTWALGLHICSRLEQDISDIIDGDAQSTKDTHKEETKARITSDREDRQSIRKKLDMCIDPLDAGSHPPNIVNIVTGQIADSSVNVQDAVAVGTEAMRGFEKGWPKGFRQTISKKIKTISDCNKFIRVGSQKIFDTSVIYSRVIGVQASEREIDIKKVIGHELAPVPTSMYNEDGSMRICKAKSELKKRLAKETPARQNHSASAVVLDGSAILWTVHWPSKGIVVDFVENFKKFLVKKLDNSDVYLIFDRYPEYSTKSVTRDARTRGASRVFQLSEETPLPPQNMILTVSKNKLQLMSIICSNLAKDKTFHSQHTTRHKLVITGSEPAPTEIHHGVVITRNDMATTHDEADNIITQQAIKCAQEYPQSPTVVIADDTDVFVLLLYHYLNEKLSSPMYMISPVHQRSNIDIKATVQAHQKIVPSLLGAHALSGCDTVPTYFGIGKGTVLRILGDAPDSLHSLGCSDAALSDVIQQATQFIGACYSKSIKDTTMSGYRYKVWVAKFGNTSSSTPKLETLPPSTEAFAENVKRAHLQTCVWKAAICSDPPAMDPTNFGYTKHQPSKSLLPVTVPSDVPLAPDDIMKLIKCNCEGPSPCRTLRCSCNRLKLPCTLFCKCGAGCECLNDLTKTVTAPPDVRD